MHDDIGIEGAFNRQMVNAVETRVARLERLVAMLLQDYKDRNPPEVERTWEDVPKDW